MKMDPTMMKIANKASQLGLRKSPRTLQRMGRRNVAARYRA